MQEWGLAAGPDPGRPAFASSASRNRGRAIRRRCRPRRSRSARRMQALARHRRPAPRRGGCPGTRRVPGARQEWPLAGSFGRIEHFRAVARPEPYRFIVCPGFHAIVDQLDAFPDWCEPASSPGGEGTPASATNAPGPASMARSSQSACPGNPAGLRTERRRPGMPARRPGVARSARAVRTATPGPGCRADAFRRASGRCPAASALSSATTISSCPGPCTGRGRPVNGSASDDRVR